MQTRILNLLHGNEAARAAVQALDVTLSLRPFRAYLEERKKDKRNIKSDFLNYVIEQLDKHPELDDNLTVERLSEHLDLLDMIYAALSAPVSDEECDLWGLCAPITPIIFYGTDSLFNVLVDPVTGEVRNAIVETQLDIVQTKRPEWIYTLILAKVFKFQQAFKTELVKTFRDEKTGLNKYFRLTFDMRFLDVKPKEELPSLTHEEIQRILHEPSPLAAMNKVLPMTMFKFEGLSAVKLTDVTDQYAVESIKNTIVSKGKQVPEDYYDSIIRSLKTLVNSNDIEFGLLPMLKVNDKLVFNESTCLNSMLIRSARNHGIAETAYLTVAENYFRNPKLLFFKTISADDQAKQIYLKLLIVDGVKSYALMPIFYNDKLAGTLEVFSRQQDLLTEEILGKLDPAIPLIAQILQSHIEEFDSHLQEVVKEKFTSIQPAVQWKFNEAAWRYLKSSFEKNPKMETITFSDVYPLYGAIDIRNSTIERNSALRSDLTALFEILLKTLSSIQEITNLPIIGELIYKCRRKFDSIMASDSDNESLNVNEFLQNEVDPVMSYFRRANASVVPLVDAYYSAADEKTGIAYENRRQLEHSMEMITTAINNYLDLFINEQKQSYPCYFEKFRTDGIEYDIYIGQSIAPDTPFDLLYLRNLRLWQVASMAAIAKLTYLLQPKLPKQLETTQLIFANSNTIDISFRNDERRFDVEGAYNIRYQIIKKRIDKVNVKANSQRLTQVGKIAIIYNNNKDAEEYTKYIQYLQAQGTLNDDLEEIELEELQGVKGLKALRVGVKLEDVAGPKKAESKIATQIPKTLINPN
ncbi:MAG: GAF domain-containing protein [Chitinophagaceae bacterium]|nr:GAF domain-containing protein [Chitinophagaceae bacterium]